jgi:putative transposase
MPISKTPANQLSGFLFVSGGVYKRVPLFQNAHSARIFLETLEAYRERNAFRLHAYAIMPDHYHFLLWFPEKGGFRGFLRDFKSMAAQKIVMWLKKHDPKLLARFLLSHSRQRRRDPRYCILQHGNYMRGLRDGDAAIKVIEYIHLNPVKAGLALHADGYVFSSAAFYLRKTTGIVKVEWIES